MLNINSLPCFRICHKFQLFTYHFYTSKTLVDLSEFKCLINCLHFKDLFSIIVLSILCVFCIIILLKCVKCRGFVWGKLDYLMDVDQVVLDLYRSIHAYDHLYLPVAIRYTT